MAEWRTDTKERIILCKGVAHKVTETVQVCSNCGTEKYEGLDADLWSDWNVKYCPHCGEKITGGTNEMNSKKIYIPPCKFTYDFDYGLRFKRELSQMLPDIEEKLSIDELDALIDFVHNKTIAEVTKYLSSTQTSEVPSSFAEPIIAKQLKTVKTQRTMAIHFFKAFIFSLLSVQIEISLNINMSVQISSNIFKV